MGSELRIPNAAAQTRIVSGGQFWPSRREVRYSDARRGMAARECRRALQKWSRGAMRSMDWDDYLRQQAAMYRQLAEKTVDAFNKNELLDLAAVCEEVANNIEDRLTSG
jgi:hypothetical protein